MTKYSSGSNQRGTVMVKRQSQAGSVASFIVIAVVLIGAVVGGIWFARHRGNDVATPGITSSDIAKNDEKKSTNSDKKQSDDTKKESSSEQDAKKKAAEDAAKKKAAEDKKDTDDQKLLGAPDDETSTSKDESKDTSAKDNEASDSTPMARDTQPTATDLPTTGPTEDMLASVIGLIAIVGAGYIYYHFGRK